jgi:hypothetical protein
MKTTRYLSHFESMDHAHNAQRLAHRNGTALPCCRKFRGLFFFILVVLNKIVIVVALDMISHTKKILSMLLCPTYQINFTA